MAVGTQWALLQAATIDSPSLGRCPLEGVWVGAGACLALRGAERNCLRASPSFAEGVPVVSKALISL